ncbi:SAM-dependent methyltransferase [Lacimicrobium alkaliphilum]|uniref:SAM-dependent methyltransferase n=1 Tax=Lacimicrobium alkaliphilum TaxID=1526571 RepID=A0ABQ1R8Q5_9ALTE|nr:SAM-dependent methyltransferase [Lacimicrobium alkaliphilum]GGD59431.1 SAM-dependent methyltransferase [Lacimicrobium alkaliphilum]
MFHLARELNNAKLLYWHQQQRLRVLQNQQYRWLCLGDTVQSVMDLNTPQRLVLPHLHGLALALYLRPQPGCITELGLGGGAFQRYLQQHAPTSRINSIEFSHPIIHCFEEFFNPSALNLNIQQADAGQAIHHISNQDLLILDLFGEQDHPSFLRDPPFYEACLAALAAKGLLVINLLPALSIQLDSVTDLLRNLTGQPCTVVGIPGYQNKIIFAANLPLPDMHQFDALSVFASTHQVDLNQLILL